MQNRPNMKWFLCKKLDQDPFCRICHEDKSCGKLISPCKCKGTLRFMHEECLNKWMKVKIGSDCEICGSFMSVKRDNHLNEVIIIVMTVILLLASATALYVLLRVHHYSGERIVLCLIFLLSFVTLILSGLIIYYILDLKKAIKRDILV